MNVLRWIIVSAVTLFSTMAFGANVALEKVTYVDSKRSRELTTYLFYPTEEKATQTFADNIAFRLAFS